MLESDPRRLILRPAVTTDLRAQVAWGSPAEVAGFLAGVGTVVSQAFRVPVASAPGSTFRIYASDIHRIEAHATARGLDLLAMYHSHPSGTLSLSSRDRAAIEGSRWPWVILAQDGETLEATGYAAGTASPFSVQCMVP